MECGGRRREAKNPARIPPPATASQPASQPNMTNVCARSDRQEVGMNLSTYRERGRGR